MAFRLLLAAALLLAACSDGSAEDAGSPTTAPDSEATAGPETEIEPAEDDYCRLAAEFINDRSVTEVGNFSADFFDDVDERLGRLVASAPADARADLEALRAGFAETDAIFDEFDYDVSDARLAEALEQVDNAAMLDATDGIQRRLRRVCGSDAIPVVDSAQVDDIIEAFGVDRATAECLNLELGDVANIDSEELSPELLTRPVCGTSLIAILSGAPNPG